MTCPRTLYAAVLCAAVLAAGNANAADRNSTQPQADRGVFGNAPLRDAELGAVSGREGLSQVNASDQTSTVSHNTITGSSMTGAVNFDDSAFQNLNGMAVVTANTGNNVAINSSFLVNIVIGPTP